MDIVTLTKSQVRLSQWTQLVADCQASGMTVRAWCAEHDVNPKTYYYWLRKLRLQTIASLPEEAKAELVPTGGPEPVTFRKLEVQPPVQSMTPAVIVHLPYATLEVTNDASQRTVEAVLLALRASC